MGNEKKPVKNNRRQFFSLFLAKEKNKEEMVKMLTPDGKLVTVEKSVLERAANKQKASKKNIYNWMKNPSKGENS